MTTTFWAKNIPSLKDSFKATSENKESMTGGVRPLDLRCGFSQAFMKGKLEEVHITQVKFKEGNQVFIKGNFGCGIIVKDKGMSPFFDIKTNGSSSFSDSDDEKEEIEPKKPW
jgi:hypothetical protein